MSFQANVAQAALANTAFRRVLYTTERSQVVLMCVQPGEDIGLEAHEGHDQVLYFLEGHGESLLGEHRGLIGPGDVAIVPSGVYHNFVNTGTVPLKLYTVYAPPEHAPGTVHLTKAEAEAAEHEHHAPSAPAPARAVPAPSAPAAPAAAAPRRAPAGLTVGGLLGK